MELLNTILFWGCFGILIYIYAGYILVLRMLALFFSIRHDGDDSYTPAITILFSARNEELSLPVKMESIRKLNYPADKIQVLAASDASTDGTDAYLSAQPDVRFVRMESLRGKNAALNVLLPQATGEVFFFTDANTVFHPDCLRNAARHFHDPQVGAVVGELTFMQGEDWNATGRGAGLYWQYENRIKQLESRLGSLLVGGGSLLAVRRELAGHLDPRIANDLEIPARAGAEGYCILYEPECLGFEKAHTKPGEEWGRTSRIVARGLRGFTVLLPVFLRTPVRLWQFLSHKFLRWFTLLFCAGMMAGAWGLRREFFPATVFYLGVAGLLVSFTGLAVLPFPHSSRWLRPFTLAAHMLIMHTAALWGAAKAVFGKTPAAWSIPESTREN